MYNIPVAVPNARRVSIRYFLSKQAVFRVFCVRYIIILPMPIPCIVERLRAVTSDSESHRQQLFIIVKFDMLIWLICAFYEPLCLRA